MAISYERVREFAKKKQSPVNVYRGSAPVAVLPNGNFDVIDYIEKAERFECEGKSYTSSEFEQLLERAN
jgi:hypothetical protein